MFKQGVSDAARINSFSRVALALCGGSSTCFLSAHASSQLRCTFFPSRPTSSASHPAHAHMQCCRISLGVSHSSFPQSTTHVLTPSLNVQRSDFVCEEICLNGFGLVKFGHALLLSTPSLHLQRSDFVCTLPSEQLRPSKFWECSSLPTLPVPLPWIIGSSFPLRCSVVAYISRWIHVEFPYAANNIWAGRKRKSILFQHPTVDTGFFSLFPFPLSFSSSRKSKVLRYQAQLV